MASSQSCSDLKFLLDLAFTTGVYCGQSMQAKQFYVLLDNYEGLPSKMCLIENCAQTAICADYNWIQKVGILDDSLSSFGLHTGVDSDSSYFPLMHFCNLDETLDLQWRDHYPIVLPTSALDQHPLWFVDRLVSFTFTSTLSPVICHCSSFQIWFSLDLTVILVKFL
jgi:hypothetical protein